MILACPAMPHLEIENDVGEVSGHIVRPYCKAAGISSPGQA